MASKNHKIPKDQQDQQDQLKAERLRAPIQYFGGKGNMLAKLLPLVPEGGKPYVEPYCGGASLFFAREPAPVEVLNDLNGEVVNLFRCLQNRDTFEELRHRLMWTPYARAELQRALEVDETADDVTRAWATFVIHNMGVGGIRISTIGRWGRAFVSSGGMSEVTNKWLMRLSMLDAWHWRLMQVQIDSRDALEVIEYWDTPETVFYIDPPYHLDTRKDKSMYAVEPDHAHHEKLVEIILSCRGAVVLSGYAHPVYKPLEEAGWEKINFQTSCHTAVRWRGSGLQGKGSATAKAPRVETVWRNPAAVRMTTYPTHLKTHRPDSLDKPLQLALDDG